MPISGRDVQCSNCGQTWFQHHPDHPPEDDAPPAPPPEEAPKPAPPRKPVDPKVAEILRQEAETELAARRERQAASLESQPDLGLEEAVAEPAPSHADFASDPDAAVAEQQTLEARRRMARMRGEPDPSEGIAASAAIASSRRSLLPDIEEINSTLRSDRKGKGPTTRVVEDDTDERIRRREKRGFRRGFSFTMLFISFLALLYVFAPQIEQAVPEAGPLLNAYVVWVDQMRIQLNQQLVNLIAWLETAASNAASDT